jgi:hypothetical protein
VREAKEVERLRPPPPTIGAALGGEASEFHNPGLVFIEG